MLTYVFPFLPTLEVTSSQDEPGFVSIALLMPFINEVCATLSHFFHLLRKFHLPIRAWICIRLIC